jgi:hypothetical protein
MLKCPSKFPNPQQRLSVTSTLTHLHGVAPRTVTPNPETTFALPSITYILPPDRSRTNTGYREAESKLPSKGSKFPPSAPSMAPACGVSPDRT